MRGGGPVIELSQIAPGDYVFEGEDTIWRIRKDADGWGVWKHLPEAVPNGLAGIDPEDEDQWELVEGPLETMRAAFDRIVELETPAPEEPEPEGSGS